MKKQASHQFIKAIYHSLPMLCHVKPCNTMPCEHPDMCLPFHSSQHQTQKGNNRRKHYPLLSSIPHHPVQQLSSHHQHDTSEAVECENTLLLNLSLSRRSSRSIPLDIRPALLLAPELLVMSLGVDLELLEIGVDDFLAAVGALERNPVSACPLFDLKNLSRGPNALQYRYVSSAWMRRARLSLHLLRSVIVIVFGASKPAGKDPSHSNIRSHSGTTYKTRRLWCLDWQTVWLDRSSGTSCLSFAVLALDLLFILSAIFFYPFLASPSFFCFPLSRYIPLHLRYENKEGSFDCRGAYRPPHHLRSPRKGINSPSSS